MKPAWLDGRAVVAGLAIAAASASLGAAVDVRDRVAACEAEDRRQSDVNAERFAAILDKIESLRSDIKGRP